jgi:hypothetical protein
MAEEPWLAEARLSEPDALAAIAAFVSPSRAHPPGHDALDAMREGVLAPSPRLCAALADDPSGACVAALAEALGPPKSADAKTRHRDFDDGKREKEKDSSGNRESRRAEAERRARREEEEDDAESLEDVASLTALAYARTLAAVCAHHPRPREAAARFDLAARLRGFAAARRDAGGAKDAEASAEAERLAARLEA